MLDDAHWPATSALIDDACGMIGNELAVAAKASAPTSRYSSSASTGAASVARTWSVCTSTVYHPWDERLPRLRKLPDGRLVHVTDLYTERELKTSRAYNEALRQGGAQNSLNVRLDGPDGLRIVWAPADPVAADGWQSAQLQAIERLIPHIRQFVRVRQALAAAEALGSSLTGLLDNTRVGVVHLERGGRIMEANARARRLLRQGDGLFDEGGFLRARLSANNARLGSLLARAAGVEGRGGPPRSGSMTVRRSPGLPHLVVHVSPVPVRQMDFGARPRRRPGAGGGPGEPCAHQCSPGVADVRPDARGGPGGGAAGRGPQRARHRCGHGPPGRLRALAPEAGVPQARPVGSGGLGAAGAGHGLPCRGADSLPD